MQSEHPDPEADELNASRKTNKVLLSDGVLSNLLNLKSWVQGVESFRDPETPSIILESGARISSASSWIFVSRAELAKSRGGSYK